jgi:hypothetical protein
VCLFTPHATPSNGSSEKASPEEVAHYKANAASDAKAAGPERASLESPRSQIVAHYCRILLFNNFFVLFPWPQWMKKVKI